MHLTHKGINIHYTDFGHGNAVVLLHGFLENSEMWKPFISTLSAKNRIICIDLLGHGKTGCIGYVHNMELMAIAVKAVLTQLNITTCTFVGHSMGGYVALAFAEANPDYINALCLINSTPAADNLEKQQNRNRAIAAVKKNKNTFIRIAINNLFEPENKILYSEKINQVIDHAQKTPLQGIIAALEGMKVRKNRTTLFNSIPVKKLIVLGKKDTVLKLDSVVDLLEDTSINSIKLDNGHMSYVENTYTLMKILMRFIE